MNIRATAVARASAVALVALLVAVTVPLAPALASRARAATANALLSDDALRGYQQPSVAADPQDPNRLAAGYMDGNQRQVCGLAVSHDGGGTWSHRLLVAPGGLHPEFNSASDFPWCWNPVVTFGPDGTLYYVFQESRLPTPYSRLRIAVSHDAGATFDRPHLIDPTTPELPRYGYDDWWPDMSVDQNSGRVYVVWDRYPDYPQAPYSIAAAMSSDEGRTFSPPVIINPKRQIETLAPSVTVARNGTVYATWLDMTSNLGGEDVATGCSPPPVGTYQNCLAPVGIEVATLPPVSPLHASRVTEIDAAADMGCPGADWISAHLQTQFPHLCDPFHYLGPAPRIAAGALAGQLALVWYEGSPQGPNRIHLTTSADGGATWRAQRTVGASPASAKDQQIMPWLTVSPGGRLDLVYYALENLQFRNTEFGLEPTGRYDVDWMASSDWGATFTAPARLDDEPSDLRVGPIGFDDWPTYGMRLGAASLQDRVFAAWTDTRRGDVSNAKQDVAFAGVQAPVVGSRGPGLGAALLIAIVAAAAVVVGAGAGALVLVRRRRSAGVPART